jgi:hypothetical protein
MGLFDLADSLFLSARNSPMAALDFPPRWEKETEPDGRVTELIDLPCDEDTLFRLFTLFQEGPACE